MALSEEEVTKVQKIIAAFENGKQLSDLPMVGASNPFDLIVEVLENGESKQAKLATMLPYLENECAYGIEFDTAVSEPKCTRIGNLSLHKTLPVHNRMRGCLLSDKGDVNAYLDPLNWTGFVLDGTKGQVMVELPMYYRKFETDGKKRRVMISEYPLPGYHQVKKKYVSAYEATVESGDKLASIKNNAVIGGNGTDKEKYAGCPRTSISRTNFRTYARKRNEGSDTRWNCMTYDIQKDLYWLFAIEYATLNSQDNYTAEKDGSGYAKGGLGAGVTTLDWNKWSTMNGNNPFIKCGTTDTLGNGTGYVEVEMKDLGYSDSLKVQVPRYRGIENIFGHIWQWTDGINVQVEAGDGKSKVYVCHDPSKFNDTSNDNYIYVGDEARVEGYIKEMIFGDGGEIIPSVVGSGGSSNTYFCDYHYTNVASASLRGLLFGGSAAYGTNAGLVYAYSTNVPSNTAANIGSRLCFIPS